MHFLPVFELMSDSLTAIQVKPHQCPSHHSIIKLVINYVLEWIGLNFMIMMVYRQKSLPPNISACNVYTHHVRGQYHVRHGQYHVRHVQYHVVRGDHTGPIFLLRFRLYVLYLMFRFMFANICFEKNENSKIYVMFITKHNMK